MKFNCEIVKDLLPLYADEVCSEESRKAVAEHIGGCPGCRTMLQNMSRDITINVNKDIGTLKRIKRRIWMERIVIALVAVIILLSVGWMLCFGLLNTDQTMDYEKYNLAENVYAEEDAEGNVWVVKQGPAIEAWMMYPNLRDRNGNYMTDAAFSKDDKNGFVITLKERKINDFFILQIDSGSRLCQERTMVIDADSDLSELYYYDDTTDTEYLLWKRGENND